MPPPGVRTVRLTRPLSLSILFLLYMFAYLVVPYWDLPARDWQKLGMAVFTGCLGLAWAWLSSGAMEIRFSRREAVWLLVALGLLGAINAMPLCGDLSWRGDEDHHFRATRMMAKYAWQCWLPCLIALVPLIATLLWRRGPSGKPMSARLVGLQAAMAAAVVLAIVAIKPKMPISPATYPLVIPWAASFVLQLGRPFLGWIPTPEVFYRLVPFLSAVGMAWHCSRHVARNAQGEQKGLSRVTRGLFIVAAGTIPALFYYSSILYLEMPVLLCMTVLCLGADDLLAAPVAELAKKPLWIALLLIGFLKDNVAPLLAVLVACRWLARAASVWKAPRRRQAALDEVRFAFCATAPYFTYAVYRVFFSGVRRTYSPAASNLADPETYGILGQAFAEQYGPAIALFVVGVVLLALRRKSRPLFLALAVFAGWALWHVLDLRTVLGYSRFMLYFAPAVLVGAVEVFRHPWRPASAAVVVVLAWIAGNLCLSPIHADGSRKPAWGQYRWDETFESAPWMKELPRSQWDLYRMDWTEHSYPYRSALRYITRTYPEDMTLLTGAYYQYWVEFYVPNPAKFSHYWNAMFSKKNLDESALVGQLLQALSQESDQRRVEHVLYQVQGHSVPAPAQTFGFTREKVFRNSAHMLVLYSLRDGQGPARP